MVTNNGVTLMLSHPVNYTHHGVTESFTGGHSIDISGIMLLLHHMTSQCGHTCTELRWACYPIMC